MEQIESILAQTHESWTLWVRDDGSTDSTPELLEQMASRDARIRAHLFDGTRLGQKLSQDWLLSRLPSDANYIFACDADDVWLPTKIEKSLAILRDEEARLGGAILLHTDLTVVDATLNTVASSLWAMTGSNPHETDLGRIAVSNVATGPTLAFNRTLLEEFLPIPVDAAYHDWWIALVASGIGRIVTLNEPTVLYRRHAHNMTSVGPSDLGSLLQKSTRIIRSRSTAPGVRRWVEQTSRQAHAFLIRFGDRLDPSDRANMEDLANLSTRGFWRRKVGVMRHHALPERGFLRNVGIVLRA